MNGRGRRGSPASERLRLIARRSPSASPAVNPASAIATWITCSWKTIDAERVLEHRLQRGVLVGDLGIRVLPQPLAPLYVGMHGAALDRPRAHQRHLHGEVVEARGQGAAAASASARGSRSGRRRWSRPPGSSRRPPGRPWGSARGRSARRARARSRPRSARPPTASPVPADRSSGSPRRRTSPCPTGRGGAPPSPTAAPGRGRSAAWWRSPSRRGAGRRGAAAPMPRGPGGQRAPARRAARRAPIAAASRCSTESAPVVHVDRARHALDLAGRQAERLAEVADRAPPAVGGERRHERGALAPVALVHARDQLLADVAREVEVDVGRLGDLLVQEAPQEQLVADRVDVREAGQVADDRADARAAPAPRRQQAARRVRPRTSAATSRASSSMSWWSRKNPDSPSLRITRSSSSSRRPRLAVLGRRARSAARAAPGRSRPAAVGVGVLRARVAVAEVAREVELEPLREPRRSRRPRRDGRAKRAAISAAGEPSPTRVAAPLAARSGRASPPSRTATARPGGAPATGWCECTLPVATHGTPSRSASCASQRLRARSWRQNGRCSSTRKRSRPKARQQPAAERLAPRAEPSPLARRAGERAVARAARQADEPLGVRARPDASGSAGGRRSRRVGARVRVGLGDQPAEVG